MLPIRRRTVLKLVCGSAAYAAALPLVQAAIPASTAASRAVANDSLLSVEFDHALRTRISAKGQAITGFDASEALLLADGSAVEDFAFVDERIERVRDRRHGPGRTCAGHRILGVHAGISVPIHVPRSATGRPFL